MGTIRKEYGDFLLLLNYPMKVEDLRGRQCWEGWFKDKKVHQTCFLTPFSFTCRLLVLVSCYYSP